VHPKYGTPWVALVVSSAIYSIFILGPFQSLVVVDVTIYAGALALEFVALIALRITHPNMKRPYKIPGGWFAVITVAVLPMAVIAFAVWAQIQDVGLVQAVGWAALGLATGPPLYYVARFFKRRRGEEERDVEVEFEDEPTLELRGES
jgi:amino acid transporter